VGGSPPVGGQAAYRPDRRVVARNAFGHLRLDIICNLDFEISDLISAAYL